MKGKLQKGLMILAVALLTGIFVQFSVDRRTESEQDFVFKPSPPPFLDIEGNWADSVLSGMTPEEKLGQLLMVASYPQQGKSDIRRVTELIKKEKIGGIIFFKANPEEIAELTAYYQSISRVPLLFAVDGEWGASMRFSNTIVYPRQMMLGAIDDNDVIYQMGRDIGRQLRTLGIHVNFAPVVDVNNNPANPVINSRSFGEDHGNVARKGILYMKGMQDEGILAVAKHFPGHGDTDKDSHHALPVMNHARSRLDSIELFPFRALIEAGVGGVMTAHLNIPAFDTTPGKASTLSAAICDTLLQQELNFKGLVFTDAMTMKGVADYYDPVEANELALLAGNDIILMPGEESKTLRHFQRMLKDSLITEETLDTHCQKVLRAKQWSVLPVMKENKINGRALLDSLNHESYELNRQKLIEKAITVAVNKQQLLPLRNLDTLELAVLHLGTGDPAPFAGGLQLYSRTRSFCLTGGEEEARVKEVLDSLKGFDLVILGIHSEEFRPTRNFGIGDDLIEIADKVLLNYNTVVAGFVSPYLLDRITYIHKSRAIIVAYENDAVTQNMAAQIIFGARPASGKLPVGIAGKFLAGSGVDLKPISRLRYGLPLEAGFDGKKLEKIDSLVKDALQQGAMPGCQVLVARHGEVVFHKAYGYHTYQHDIPVLTSDLYDLASLTKILATVPSIMQLERENQIDITEPLSRYLPELDTTNKGKMRMDDVLLHQAGLAAWIPFYLDYIEPLYPNQKFAKARYSKQYPIKMGSRYYVNKHLKYTPNSFARESSPVFTVRVADGLFMNPQLIDSLWLTIYATDMGKRGDYKYSDLGFYLFYRMIERVTERSFDSYVIQNFYAPLGAYTLGFHPTDRFPLYEIVPTENDLVFRRQVVHGTVHDPGAAMLGGVSGHAGLFANANDVAKMMQMILNGGTYGGHNFLDPDLISEYTSCVACDNGNRRGLGFDKPEPDTAKGGPTFAGIPLESFGHTGFTGTMVWADPGTGVLYVFLSNRIHPDVLNRKLVSLDLRTNIQQAVYEALLDDSWKYPADQEKRKKRKH